MHLGIEPASGADEQEEKRDAREPRYDIKRWRGTSHDSSRGTRQPEAAPQKPMAWMAAPLPNELRSLGYPATNTPRGKAQAGNPLLLHHLFLLSFDRSIIR
jgi:hypothetical protein